MQVTIRNKRIAIKKKVYPILLIIVSFILMHCNIRKREPLPSFNILLLDSATILNTSQIPEGKAFVIVYFSPDCDHCQRETKDLIRNMDKISDTQFYFITANHFNELKGFNNEYKLSSYKNIIMGRDYQLFMMRNFKATPPYLAIYDENKIKRAVFEGENKVEKIIEVLHNIQY